MRQLKIFCLALVLAVAACRSVPADVRAAHDGSQASTSATMTIASQTLSLIESKSEELSDESVSHAFDLWKMEYNNLIQMRLIVLDHLKINPKDSDVVTSYILGNRLLSDMNVGFNQIDMHWKLMLDGANADKVALFIKLFRRDIKRFRILNRKFDEWIRQFTVKG